MIFELFLGAPLRRKHFLSAKFESRKTSALFSVWSRLQDEIEKIRGLTFTHKNIGQTLFTNVVLMACKLMSVAQLQSHLALHLAPFLCFGVYTDATPCGREGVWSSVRQARGELIFLKGEEASSGRVVLSLCVIGLLIPARAVKGSQRLRHI